MLLAVDTSGPICAAAVVDDATVVISRSDEIGRGHAEHLFPMLEDLLKEANLSWADMNQIACTTGPGSFTGLRVGLATARGLALALDCPCVGVTVFDAFAYGIETPLTIALDARRDQVWFQHFANNVEHSTEPEALSVDEAYQKSVALGSPILGSAAHLPVFKESDLEVLSDAASPPIVGVALAALQSQAQQNRPKPLYLRAPDAKRQIPIPLG